MGVPLTSVDSPFVLQLVRYGLISAVLHLNAENKLRQSLITFLPLAIIGTLGTLWLWLVTEYVPEPYLDEVFHIPQVQVYCDGRWSVWDDKITTPPGLYVLTILANRLTGYPCSTYYLRLFNVERLSYLPLAAVVCRTWIEQPKTDERQYSAYAIFTGINIALFPALFFFSGLYYTDVASTFVVVLAYTNHLDRVKRDTPTFKCDLYTICLGLLSLCMRQTNIFWVVVYIGGLEAIQGIKVVRPQPVSTPGFTTLSQQLIFYAWRYSLGDIHDPSVNLSSPVDLLLCVLSVGIASVCNIGTVLRRIWPHLVVLCAFIGFVAWNGGVVLGDKSNHVATIHLAQMLYIWPLFAFFSAPLFIPQILSWSTSIFRAVTGLTSPVVSSNKAPTAAQSGSKSSQSRALKTFNWMGTCYRLHSILVLGGTLAAAVLIVRYNTIIHPFTLADNRHYMFYVFRYTILRAWWIRYALAPAYVLCGWLCWTALGSSSFPGPSANQQIQAPFGSTSEASLPFKEKQPQSSSSNASQANESLDTVSPPTSTALVLLLSAVLSLVTAPLVEPRYFIVPWVFWRLLVPARPALPGSASPASRWLVPVLETAWFLLVNAVTMYVFITRPFFWRAPDGSLLDDGRVQRFMW
ncbi:glycosyltransferase family 59 protein [Hypoxylon sp. FL1284]|nr:glycosyltransferase family 59 protein [Hypoxylon sp. FL1284]